MEDIVGVHVHKTCMWSWSVPVVVISWRNCKFTVPDLRKCGDGGGDDGQDIRHISLENS